MSIIYPDSPIVIEETGRLCRMGLITRDSDKNYWGLTVKHVLEGRSKATIRTPDGTIIGDYLNEECDVDLDKNDVSAQLVKFKIRKQVVGPDNVKFGVTWPRYTVEPGNVLGASVISIESRDRKIGTIVEVNSTSKVRFRESAETTLMTGSCTLSLNDKTLVKRGLGGTLLLSEAGEAIALGVATQKSKIGAEVIAAPVGGFIERAGLRLWAPLGAHWSDLTHRSSSFLSSSAIESGIDLGRPPVKSKWRT